LVELEGKGLSSNIDPTDFSTPKAAGMSLCQSQFLHSTESAVFWPSTFKLCSVRRWKTETASIAYFSRRWLG